MSDIHTGYDHNTYKILTKFFDLNKEVISSLDVLIIAGDLASHSQHQHNTLFRILRERFDIPILVVWGNHDMWQHVKGRSHEHRKTEFGGYTSFSDYHAIHEGHIKVLNEYNIHHLGIHGPVQLVDDTGTRKIWGFDGWYNDVHIPSNDRAHMRRVWQTTPPDPFQFLIQKAYKDFTKVFNEAVDETCYKILVTHFPPMVLAKDDKYSLAPPKKVSVNSNSYFRHHFSWYRDQNISVGIKAFLEPMSENFNLVLMGHFHGYYKKVIKNCIFRTTGCNYNQPRLQVLY